MKGQAQQATNFERTLFDPGTYTMTLTKILALWGKPTQYQPDGAPKVMFVWEYEAEGEKYELSDFLGFPKNFAYNDKSNFWKRVAEIAGVTINSDNADTVDMDFGSFIQSYDELVEHLQGKDERGNNQKAEATSLTVGDQQLLGKACQLVVKVWEKDGKSGNDIAAVLQVGGGAGPRKPGKAAQPASTPPARPAAPQQQAAPGQDLPF